MNTVVGLVKNKVFPSCKKCIYNIYLDKVPKCTRFNYKNNITGNIELEYASKMRKDDTKCSKKGIFYSPI